MPQTRVEIEELGPGRWVAEVEGGGTAARRKSARGVSFDEIILEVIALHAELVPPAAVVRPVKEVLADRAARDDAARAADEAAALAAGMAASAAMRADDAAFAQAHAVEESDRLMAEAEAIAERTRQDEAAAPVASVQRTELIAQAEALGLAIDRRWGDARLREVVAAERARRATSP